MSRTSQRGRGGGVRGNTSTSVDTGKKCTIHWEGVRGARTERLLAWCKENEDARIKLFSDSAKDAKEQGRKKKQSGSSRDVVYLQVAQAVFSNDEDPEVQRLFKEDPKAFIKPVSTRFGTLRKKYNEFNKDLKQSGAGKTYAELQEDPKMKSLIDTRLEKFPWWPELHGWWRTNPAFNHAFSTADAGQDFASAALEHFNISKPPATGDDDAHADDDPEDGEIVEINSHTMDNGVTDDMIVDQPPCIASLQPSPLLPSDHSPSNTPDSFSLVPLPQWYQRPQLPPISTSDALGPGMISLNSPEHSPVAKKNPVDNSLSFFSDYKESSPSRQSTPIDSEDSDIGASRALQSLRVSSLKGSRESSPSLATKQSRPSPSSASQCPPSSSRKRPGSSTLDQTTERMSQTAESLMLHLDSKREVRAEHERYKRMKLESEIWARDLKARSARDEREHAMRLAEQDHHHQQERMTRQMEIARIELELSHARREEEEARIRRIAMERGFDQS